MSSSKVKVTNLTADMTEAEVREQLAPAIQYCRTTKALFATLPAGSAARAAIAKSHDAKLDWIRRAERFIRHNDRARSQAAAWQHPTPEMIAAYQQSWSGMAAAIELLLAELA